MALNPIKASKAITEKYLRYIKTTFFIKDQEYMTQFKKNLEKAENFAKGPYIDYIGSFKTGKSIEELIKNSVLSQEFKKLYQNEPDLLTRRLYKHQEEAIIKCIEDKNLVVSTGTGSGKTESFLIPIINHLMSEKERGELDDGVRALIIYPMNALANDQMKRMSELLRDYPDITFGAYTGETKHTEKEAQDNYLKLNDSKPVTNHILSRDRMKEHPPHIFITNYAMLEFLMLKPEENVFFNGEKANKWKYIVLDEAHTYTGATGIEVSMLLRRVKNQLPNNEKIRFILTSATLGGKNDTGKVCEFASKFCADATFKEDCVIHAKREKVDETHGKLSIPSTLYQELSSYLGKVDIKKEEPKTLKNIIYEYYSEFDSSSNTIKSILYDLIIQDKFYYRIRKLLLKSAETIQTISDKFGMTQEELISFVFVANLAEKENIKLFDARYHMFLKSLEGVYVTLGKKKTLTVFPHNTKIIENDLYKCYKIAVCKYCGQIYIEGIIEETQGKKILVQKTDRMQKKKRKMFMLLEKGQIENITNDDETNISTDYLKKQYILCGKCGLIQKKAEVNHIKCNCGESNKVELLEIDINKKQLHKCAACNAQNNRGSVLRNFYLGQEAAASVIGTSLYEEIESKIILQTEKTVKTNGGFFGEIDSEKITKQTIEKNKEKQLLVFSDSRQQAAYFASYFDFTYNNLLRRKLLITAIQELQEEFDKNTFELETVAERIAYLFENYHIEKPEISLKEAWKTLLYEISSNDRNSLENLGLLSFEYKAEQFQKLGFYDKEEVLSIQRVLANTFKKYCIFKMPVKMTAADIKYFIYTGKEKTISLSNPSNKYGSLWIPKSTNKKNQRLDYVERTKGQPSQKNIDFLKLFWEQLLITKHNSLILESDNNYQMNISKFIVRSSLNDELDWYICDKCGKLTVNNISNICPTYRCDGPLRKCDVEKEFRENHYRKIYKEMEIFPMVCKEHTAQLSPELARDYQEQFVKKEINVLSCSTTFEMGVDVGELETVFMKNMPPTPANYIQRAGRAGRRSDAVAYSLTFCKLSSHDFNYFQNPSEMINGKIMPPAFKIENIKIIKRHVNAAIIAYFWRKYPEYYKDVDSFFKQDSFDKFLTFLYAIPEDLKGYLKSFVPKILKDSIDEWVQELNSEQSYIKKIRNEYLSEISELEAYRSELKETQDDPNEQNVGTRSDKIKNYIKYKLKEEEILQFLSRKNIIPKYGFPVDTVELTTSFDKSYSNLRLQRDLKIAISEYAPGSEIVANGQILKSQFVKIPKGRDKNKITQYQFSVCENKECNHLNIRLSDLKGKEWNCEVCGESISSEDMFIIPDYGFIINTAETVKATTKKPEKTYHSQIYYVGDKNELNSEAQSHCLNDYHFEIKSTSDDELAVINTSFFHVCPVCGYSEIDKGYNKLKSIPKEHKNPYGYTCPSTKLYRKTFGHIFKTDVITLAIGHFLQREKALSILYALLEGISEYLKIERTDISGTIHSQKTKNGGWQTSFIIFDTVPGGAGHVRRIGKASTEEFFQMLKASYDVVKNCQCGTDGNGDSACYNCLCNYYNQAYHDILKRQYAVEFFEPIIMGSDKLPENNKVNLVL